MKKSNEKGITLITLLIIIGVILVVACASIVFLVSGKNKKENNVNEKINITENSSTINYEEEEEEESQEDISSVNSTRVMGLKGETLDYYWNIDTTKFDASKFNGDIYFYGTTLDGKITSNKLKQAGFEIDTSDNRLVTKHKEFGYNYSSLALKKGDNKINLGFAGYLVNYTGDDAIYSDNTLFTIGKSLGWDLTKYNIYPSIFNVESASDINIDMVLEKLGNPTYVKGRTSKVLKDKHGYTIYVYVYEDVTFLFAFYNNKSDLRLASAYYYPTEQMMFKESEGINEIERLENEYKEYKNSEK